MAGIARTCSNGALLVILAAFAIVATVPPAHGFLIQQGSIDIASTSLASVHVSACRLTHVAAKPSSSAAPATAATTSTTRLSFSAKDIIEAGVSVDTFAPQFLWLLLIGLPDADLTKRIMGPITPLVALALVHLTIVAVAAAQEGALGQVLIFQEVFDPALSQLSGMQKLFAIPNFVAEEWPHVLIWDLFVGRQIWIDGLERGINTRLSLAFCNFIGPPGLLIYVATCLLSGKGLPSMGYKEEDEEGDRVEY